MAYNDKNVFRWKVWILLNIRRYGAAHPFREEQGAHGLRIYSEANEG